MVARSPVWFNRDSLAVRFSPLVIKVDIFPLEVCHETSGVYRTCFDLIAVFSFAYQGITYRSREKVIDVGPIEATVEKQKTIPLSAVFGAIAFVGGIALVILGNKS